MKKTLLFTAGAILGYALNTESGKNIRNWAITKAQEQINNLVGKINEMTTSDSLTPETKTEGEK